jgi:hypothetical protein
VERPVDLISANSFDDPDRVVQQRKTDVILNECTTSDTVLIEDQPGAGAIEGDDAAALLAGSKRGDCHNQLLVVETSEAISNLRAATPDSHVFHRSMKRLSVTILAPIPDEHTRNRPAGRLNVVRR